MTPPNRPDRKIPRRGRMIGAGVVAVAVIVAALAAVLGGGSSPATQSDLTPAPDVSYGTFHGETVALSELQGKPLVLNFFASWCPACIAEMPDFESVHASIGGDRVTFLGLATQDEANAAYALRDETGITYETGLDPDGVVYQAFGGIAMPTTVFIDADGNVVETHSGVLFADDLEAKVTELLLGG